jgi:hypothetical protein
MLLVSDSSRIMAAPPAAAAMTVVPHTGISAEVEQGERNTRYMDRLLRGVVAASAHSRSKLGERPVVTGKA